MTWPPRHLYPRKEGDTEDSTSSDDRTTEELINALGDDVDRCHDALIKSIDEGAVDPNDGGVVADYEFHARNLIRAIIAAVEGITFSVKATAVSRCLDSGIEVTDHERHLAVDVECDLNDKGEVVARAARLNLLSNVRFGFRMLERSSAGRFRVDLGSGWWEALRKTIKVRDRLTHPRFPADIDISGDEVVTALEAIEGFKKALIEFGESGEPPP